MRKFIEDLERRLQDDEFALAYAEAERKSSKQIYRCIYSRFRFIWRILYKSDLWSEFWD